MANREARAVDQTGSTSPEKDGSGPGGRETVMIRAFVALADSLVEDYDVIELLDRLAGYSVELLVADAAGIMLGDAHQQLRVVASTNEQSDWMELLQLEADEGPCVEWLSARRPGQRRRSHRRRSAVAAVRHRPGRTGNLRLGARAAAAAAR